ncbi:hypothetical protein [Agromyces albus]|uniref:hypothetical protein n=1 Tax=Agromyces albus TaxID=205332 RepID=UPI0027D89487|nr:hypothetical protein [Agromyces albus]
MPQNLSDGKEIPRQAWGKMRTSNRVEFTVRILAAAVIAVTLSACASAAPAATPAPQTTAPTATPTPTPTPVADPLDSVTSLVARPTALELRSGDGTVIASLDYMSSPAAAISALTTVFGAPPVEEPYQGTNHTPPGIYHVWDEFVLDERHYDEERRAEGRLDYIWPRLAVHLEGPSAQGIDLTSEQGFRAGDDWSSLSGDPVFDADLWTCYGTPVETLELEPADGDTRTATVVVRSGDDGTVGAVGAPEMIADGCA